MSDIKTKNDEKNITETYEEFVNLINREYPNPLYFYDEEEEYAERFVKETPEAKILGNGIKGRAICKDIHSSLMYAYENAKVLNDFVYAVYMFKLGMVYMPVEIVWRVEGGD